MKTIKLHYFVAIILSLAIFKSFSQTDTDISKYLCENDWKPEYKIQSEFDSLEYTVRDVIEITNYSKKKSPELFFDILDFCQGKDYRLKEFKREGTDIVSFLITLMDGEAYIDYEFYASSGKLFVTYFLP